MKPGLAEGTRDLGPEQVAKRNYIFDTIRAVFVKFGFQPLETPAMENLSTLTGKYGEEGDRLLFKILNNGDYLKDADKTALADGNSVKLIPSISKRGLRYDLTVPFARYVVMNRHALAFPFKRYQIQPVWRADRPQKGRYREFYQCDVDVIGSESLIYEVELVRIYDEVFAQLKLPVTIKINNRKVLFGIAEATGIADKFVDMTVAVDKLDKIGADGVKKELLEREIPAAAVEKIVEVFQSGTLDSLRALFENSPTGQQGLQELDQVFGRLKHMSLTNSVVFDVTLARGLSYYTGCIFEVAALGISMGSIGGGGRYADLTGVFDAPGLSGVGISFGADRIYDVLQSLELFPESISETVKVIFAAFDEKSFDYAFGLLCAMRDAGIASEIYPEPAKIKKQLDYVNKRNIPYAILVGDTEVDKRVLAVKNMRTGEQIAVPESDLIHFFTSN